MPLMRSPAGECGAGAEQRRQRYNKRPLKKVSDLTIHNDVGLLHSLAVGRVQVWKGGLSRRRYECCRRSFEFANHANCGEFPGQAAQNG